jgi:hypothetical protein
LLLADHVALANGNAGCVLKGLSPDQPRSSARRKALRRKKLSKQQRQQLRLQLLLAMGLRQLSRNLLLLMQPRGVLGTMLQPRRRLLLLLVQRLQQLQPSLPLICFVYWQMACLRMGALRIGRGQW